MRDTFLFDLDGTLLPMDYDMFMKLYFYNIGDYFKERLDPNLLAKYIMSATEVVITDKSGLSNEDKFMNHFAALVNDDIEWFKEQFIQFYTSQFENVQASTYKSPEMRQSVDLLKKKGYKVVIATNPLFPMVANEERIKWAGFTADEFDYVSCFEDSSYTKPHLEYYQGVLDKIGKKPEDCFMVGNDIFDDLSSGHLGIETYLTTDHLVNKRNLENTANHTGTYKDFLEFVQKLPSII